MAKQRICSVEGCGNPFYGRGLCNKHYKRMWRHGSTEALRPANGECEAWLCDHVAYGGDECLIWPFWRDKHGYGRSREMCMAAYGEPPTREHQAAHSCGKGHEGCVNPKHLYWATRKENQAEMARHGNSQRGEKCTFAKLTKEQVLAIRQEAKTEYPSKISRRYSVDEQTVLDILCGKTWSWLTL